MLNGVSKLFMMKTDVLSPFEELEICTSYEIDGKKSAEVPYDMTRCEIDPVLTTMEGWNENIETLPDMDQAPQALNTYIEYVEKETGVPIEIVSIGPDRKQTLFR